MWIGIKTCGSCGFSDYIFSVLLRSWKYSNIISILNLSIHGIMENSAVSSALPFRLTFEDLEQPLFVGE